jgi:3-oxosteroid 1-dehydrogenase
MDMGLKDRNFVVVGSGAAGLVGAVTAHAMGLRPVIIEKADVWGGTTALSGGVLWVPCNHLMAADGDSDDPQTARDYVMKLMGEEAASPRVAAKVDRYIAAAPEMMQLLERQGVRWARNADHPDYYPRTEGAIVGRTVESDLVNERELGPLLETLRTSAVWVPPMLTRDAGDCMRAKTGLKPMLTAARVVLKDVLTRAMGRDQASRGRALLVSLMMILRDAGVPLLLETRLVSINRDGGRVAGVTVQTRQGERAIAAPAGVLLASGGFARNRDLRLKYHGDVDGSWTSAPPEDEGDALIAGQSIGASTEFMGHAWWQPSLPIAPGMAAITLSERAFPGSLIVDDTGHRFMNEAESYMASGRNLRDHGGATRPCWLIFDESFVHRYIFRALGKGAVQDMMIANGNMKIAASLGELAQACGLDPQTLSATVARFNRFAQEGVDEDFDRGATNYDKYWADPGNKPNPSLGPVSTGPFYAARIVPGDLGTNGGLMTDQDSRVLDEKEQVIAGLYAAGNCSSSPFGGYYPGGGATIGAATTFGYLAAAHAARAHNQGGEA